MTESEVKTEKEETDAIAFFLFLMAGIATPVFLIPITKITGYSEIIEELAKGLFVFFLVLSNFNLKSKLFFAIFFGFSFALSEDFLYLFNILENGNENIFFYRFISSLFLNISTCLFIFFLTRAKKYLIFLGIGIAIAIHLAFNSSIFNIINSVR